MMKAVILLFCVYQIALGVAHYRGPCPDNLPSSCICAVYPPGGDEYSWKIILECSNLDQNAFEAVCKSISGVHFSYLGFRHSTFTRLHAFAFKGVSADRLAIENVTVSDVDPDAFSQTKYLKIVDIKYTLMTKLPNFEHVAGTLVGMAVTESKISQVTNEFSGLVNLKTVNLDYNDITDVEDGAFYNLKALERLQIDVNEISKIGNWFNGNEKCVSLSFEGNVLTEFPDNLFKQLPNLLRVKATGNKITTIKKSLFQGFLAKPLAKIGVRGNKIVCDNKLCWLNQYKSKVYGACAGPQALKGKEISEVNWLDAGCDSYTTIHAG